MYVYTTTTKIVFLVVIEHFSLFCRLSFLYDFKGVFDMTENKTCAQREPALFIKRTANTKNIRFPPM